MLDLLQRTALPMRWEPVQVIKMRGMSLSERLTMKHVMPNGR